MSDNKESNNFGCIIAIISLVIINLFFFFKDTSAESIAESGSVLLTIAGIAIACYVCNSLFGKKSNDNNNSINTERNSNKDNDSSESPGGCILIGIVCVIFTAIIIFAITSSFSLNYAVGVVVVVVFAIIIGYLMYNSFKD